MLLTGAILPTLLRLAAPNVLATTMGVVVGIAETFIIGRLGIEALAAMALVFPFAMLTGMLSAGAMGGGVSSSLARAFGAQQPERAQAVALHALIIGAVVGALYALLLVVLAPWLFVALGGQGPVLRGSGNMAVPSYTLVSVAAAQVFIGGVLGLGLLGLPRWGMPGVAAGQIVATSIGVVFLFLYQRLDRARLRLRLRLGAHGIALQRGLFWDILRVGVVACLSPLQSVLTG